MTKEQCVKLLEALGKDKEFDVIEFPAGSGMFIFVCSLQKRLDKVN